ncbi:AAA family ATPase [Yoonia sp. R2331]|uniref:AAA family ATPase n=1 Tax=Yoonia sp. R2331 TaxID=3237238 RepID=UPI0034E4CB0D
MPDTAPIIHINGWSGTGKLTIARELAQMIGARLLDNHTLMNAALALFDRGTPEYRALRQDLRDTAFAAASDLPATTALVLTDAFSDDPYEEQLFADVLALAKTRGARLIRVILDITEGENLRRLTGPGRVEARKLTDPDILRDHRANHVLLGHDDPTAIHLDVTDLSPKDAALDLIGRAGLLP